MFFSAFIFGFLSAILALVLELILIPPASFPEITALSWSVWSILLLAGIACIEEISKYLFLSRYLLQFSESIVRTSQKISLGILFGLGFALLELTLAYYDTPFFTLNSGLFGIIALHSITSLILILLPSWFHDAKTKVLLPLGVAITLHLCYNVLLSFLLA